MLKLDMKISLSGLIAGLTTGLIIVVIIMPLGIVLLIFFKKKQSNVKIKKSIIMFSGKLLYSRWHTTTKS